MADACATCTALLNEALNLTVRGRTLDGIQRRSVSAISPLWPHRQ